MTELLNQEEKGLVQDLRLSFSRISSFDQEGPSALIKRKELSGIGITMGGLVDLLLFQPDEFKSNYYVFRAKIPTATTKELADIIINNYSTSVLPDNKAVLEIIKHNEFWGSIKKEDTLIKKFDNEEFWDYIKAMLEAKGKEVIDEETLRFAEELVDILKTHENSKGIVAYPEKNEDKYAQLELNFQYKQFKFKGIVDLVIVNHADKTIQFIDLKTGSPSAQEFSKSFVKYRYYLQALLYTIGAQSFMEEYNLKDYQILDFQFLYIGRYQKVPYTYTVSEKWQTAAAYGFTTKSGYEYKGLNELIDDIDWHWTNKEFGLPRNMAEAEGEIYINDNFIEINE